MRKFFAETICLDTPGCVCFVFKTVACDLLIKLRMDMTITLLNKMMDVSAERHKVIANNLANANTPGYVRQDIRFRDSLAKAVESRDIEAIESFKPEIYADKTRPFRPDGNNVSSQVELSEMTENQLLYRMTSKAMSLKLQRLKKAVGGAAGG